MPRLFRYVRAQSVSTEFQNRFRFHSHELSQLCFCKAFLEATPPLALQHRFCAHRYIHKMSNTFGKKVILQLIFSMLHLCRPLRQLPPVFRWWRWLFQKLSGCALSGAYLGWMILWYLLFWKLKTITYFTHWSTCWCHLIHSPKASQYSYHVAEPRWTLVSRLDMITPLALIPFLRCLLVLPPWNSYVEATRWSLELNVSHWQLPNEWHDSTLIYIHHAGVIHFPRFQRQRSACHSMTIYDRCASKEGEVSSMQEARIDAVNVGWSLERDTLVSRPRKKFMTTCGVDRSLWGIPHRGRWYSRSLQKSERHDLCIHSHYITKTKDIIQIS